MSSAFSKTSPTQTSESNSADASRLGQLPHPSNGQIAEATPPQQTTPTKDMVSPSKGHELKATGLSWAHAADELPLPDRAKKVFELATEAFTQTGSWVVFYREVLGRNGLARQAFNNNESMAWFLKSNEYSEIQEMVAALRSQDTSKGDSVEPEKMITIRLPQSLHDVLTDEAEEMNLSINKLCISKLLQPAESRYVPEQQGRRRGRRPGPQGPRKNVPTDK